MTTVENAGRLVIGLTGPLGSGVTTISYALGANGFQRVSMSEPIKKELREKEDLPTNITWDEEHVPNFRKKLQDIGNDRRKEDPVYWATKAIQSIDDNTDVVIDGIRNMAEADKFRRMYSKFFLVGVHALTEERKVRLVYPKYGGDLKLFDRDDKRDADEELDIGQQVGKCMLESDYVFVNESLYGSSETHYDNLYEDLKGDLELMRHSDKPNTNEVFRRPPVPEEIHMATAFAQSHGSQCLKRHVGAVVVDREGRALSLGYNENPIGMDPCHIVYKSKCFKDIDMEKKLEDKHNIHCPECGTKIPNLHHPWLCTNDDCKANLKRHFFPDRNMVLCTAIHAEERAIRSLGDRSATGGTIYSTTCPCFQCARYIVDAGIRRVVYVEAYPIKESIEFLRKNNVVIESFRGFKARAFNLIFKQVE